MALSLREQDTQAAQRAKKPYAAPVLQTRGTGPVSPLLMCTAPEVSCEAFGLPNLCVQDVCQCDDSC